MREETAFADGFGDFDGRIWINCAHQGALPLVAAAEAREAIEWKLAPYKLTTERFSGVPRRLKEVLARLIGASSNDIILANSASYSLHLLANSVPLKSGDEVLLVEGDFPSNILPWLGLKQKGINITIIRPERHVIQPHELAASINKSTKVLCTSWAHSFSGHMTDIGKLGEICRDNQTSFIVNGSQALGARPIDVSKLPVDAVVSVGWKWLCGPYGTGFSWVRPELRESLVYNQSYWLSLQTADDLGKNTGLPEVKSDLGARKYDLFATANFFNFKPWTASIEYLLDCGIEKIHDHDQRLVSRFVDGLDRSQYDLISPEDGPSRSTLIFISHKDRNLNAEIYQKLKESGIDIAFRGGSMRFAPHLYNTIEHIDRALEVLVSARSHRV